MRTVSKTGIKGLGSDKSAENRAKTLDKNTNKTTIISTNTNNESVIKSTNNNDINPFDNVFKPSIGKWMYENDEYLEGVAIDLSLKSNNNNTNKGKQTSNNDDIVFIGHSSAGPSGLNVNHSHNKNINNLITNCDSDPTERNCSSDLNVVFETISETITIYDLSSDESNQDCDNSNGANADEPNDVEIIKVKYFTQPSTEDSDIEVLSEILTPKEIIDLMKNNLKSVQQLTHLSFTTIRVLMTKYKWNKDLFVNQFFEFGIERILQELKFVISYELKANTKKRKTKHMNQNNVELDSIADNGRSGDRPVEATVGSDEKQKTCLVCFDETNASQMFGSNCGHYLCIDCWNQYITTRVKDRSSDDKICCPGDNCSNIVDDEDLLAIIEEQVIGDKYQRLISNSFVTNDPLLRWCPNGDCLHAVRVKQNSFQDIECICKTVFCFLCGDQWHEPLSCELYKNWIQKYASQTVDPNSAKWLLTHTKCCPKCKFPIEKNGGCNYVLCTKCRYSFCYHCLGKCSHGRCLGQNADDALRAQSDDQRLKNDLRLYPFYKDSYQNQLKQLTLEKNLQEGVNRKLESAVKSREFKSALKFLKSAFTVLCHCRQTLMYSYVFGYYLMGPQNEINVYTNNLHELEKQTIKLSTILTNETTVIQRDSVIEMKHKVQSSYRQCESKRSALVQHIKYYLTHNLWEFIPI